MQRAKVDFPEPLSPTTPSVSPLRKSRVTSFTAWTNRFGFPKPKKLLPPPNLFWTLSPDKTICSERGRGARGTKLGTDAIKACV